MKTLEASLQGRSDPTDLGTSARSWLQRNTPRLVRTDCLQYGKSPTVAELRTWEASMHRAGLVGATWPRAYGGQALTLREHLAISREIGRMPILESVNSIGKELAGPIILAIGTEAQKQRFLPAILEMRDIWCQGFSEPGAGSDLAGLRTKAQKVADGWLINGQKIWTSAASKAQRCLLLARTGSVEDKHRGLVLFTVAMDLPGIDVKEIRSIDGRSSFCEVFFNDVVVPEADMLGAPDEGWTTAVRVLTIERATNRMHRPWRFENELTHLVAACAEDAKASAVLREGPYRARLASVAVDIELLKAHVETLVESMLAGANIGSKSSFPKLFWSEAHQRFAVLALEIVSQFRPGAPEPLQALQARVQDIYLKSRAETIYAGTTEIQLDIIAKRVLKLSGDG